MKLRFEKGLEGTTWVLKINILTDTFKNGSNEYSLILFFKSTALGVHFQC